MVRTSGHSVQTLAVLSTLLSTPSGWRHGYDIAKETGLRSGTLYPILIRLADRGLVDSCWEAEQPAGRPRRHMYRLSAEVEVAAQAALAVSADPALAPAARRRGLAVDGA